MPSAKAIVCTNIATRFANACARMCAPIATGCCAAWTTRWHNVAHALVRAASPSLGPPVFPLLFAYPERRRVDHAEPRLVTMPRRREHPRQGQRRLGVQGHADAGVHCV